MTNKQKRKVIFNKYGGRCAYCGEPLTEGWHVDELLPVKRGWKYKKDDIGNCITNEWGQRIKIKFMEYPERLNLNNQMPSCASCNINKHSLPLEEFRALIQGFMKHLNEVSTQYKIAKRYGLVKEDIKPIIFYFESCNSENNS